MDEYKRLAEQYFRLIEGLDLYPSLRAWHWYAWASTLVFFIWGLSHAISRPPAGADSTWIVLLFEAPFLVCCGAIEQFKRKALASRLGADGQGDSTLHDARRRALEELCRTSASGFAKLAKECSELRALDAANAIRPTFSLERLASAIYDRDSKPRLLALGLASLAAFVALLNKSLPEQAVDVMAVVSDGEVWKFVGQLCSMLLILFVVWAGIAAAGRQAGSFLRLWWTRLAATTAAKNFAMTYFIHDLARYHQPFAEKEMDASVVQTAPLRDHRTHMSESLWSGRRVKQQSRRLAAQRQR